MLADDAHLRQIGAAQDEAVQALLAAERRRHGGIARQHSAADDRPVPVAGPAQVIDIRAEMGAVESTHTDVDDASSQPGTVVGRDLHSIGDLRQHFWPKENTGLHNGTQSDG